MSDASLLAMAERLIAKRGRSVTIERDTASTLAQAGKPWRGREIESDEEGVSCVILPMDRTSFSDGMRYANGEPMKESDEKAYVKGSVAEIEPGNRIVDGDATYTVMQVKQYRPGSTSILWDLWVRR